jgi:hypothetical protein
VGALDPNFFADTVSDPVAEATAGESLDQAVALAAPEPLLAKLAELETANHRLRVENLTMRARIDRLKANHSFERRFHLASGASLLVLLLLTIGLAFYLSSVR